MATNWQELSLESLAGMTGNGKPGSINHTLGMAEFTRRQTEAQIEASRAQIKAANATEASSWFLLASVGVSAAALLISAINIYILIHPALFK